jgi:hypothetical protein
VDQVLRSHNLLSVATAEIDGKILENVEPVLK